MGAAKNNALMCATKAGERHDLAKKNYGCRIKGGTSHQTRATHEQQKKLQKQGT